MSCMTLFVQQAAMATTQLVEATRYEVATSWPVEYVTERKQPLHMSWVVVTGNDGKRQLRMIWKAAEAR
jgi:hypothetical protein